MKLSTVINRLFNKFARLNVWKKVIILLAISFVIFTINNRSTRLLKVLNKMKNLFQKKEMMFMMLFMRLFTMF